MTESTFLNFINSFNEFIEEYSKNSHYSADKCADSSANLSEGDLSTRASSDTLNADLLPYSLEIYNNLCDLISAMGHSILNKESFDELFKVYMEDKGYRYSDKTTDEEQMLSFILQLTDLGVNDDTMSKYSVIKFNPNEIYDSIYQKRKVEFKNPVQGSATTFVYDKSEVLSDLLEKNILSKKDTQSS